MQTIRTEILKWFFLEKNSEMTTFNFSFVIKNLKIWSVKFKTHLHQSHQFYIKMRYLMLTWTKYSYYHTFPMHQEQRNSLLYAVKLLVFLCIFLIFWYRVDIKYVKRDKDKVQYLRLNTCIPKSTICKVIAQYLWLENKDITSQAMSSQAPSWASIEASFFMLHARGWHQALDWCTVRSAKYKVHVCDDGDELMIRWSNVHAIL